MLRDNQIGASDAITASVFPARSLVGKIMDSFTRSISILRARGDPDEVSQAPAAVCLKSEDYGDSCKTPARKDRRGSYMRRFENAVTCAEKAGKFDPRNVEVAKQLTNVRLVARARARGNELFMSEKFTEACAAYEEGLKLTHPTRCFIVIELPVGLNLGCWRNLLKIATLPFASTLVMLRLFFEWLPQTVSLNDGLKLSEIMKF